MLVYVDALLRQKLVNNKLVNNKLVNNVYDWTNYKIDVELPNQFIELVRAFWSISAFM